MSRKEQVLNQDWLAWSHVFASFLTCLCTLGLSNSFGVFQTYYEHNILNSHSASSISWIGTTQGFLLSVVALISGPLYDRGYIKSLMYVGTFLSVVGLLATSFADQYSWTFLSFGVIVGLGCGAIYVPGLAIVQDYFTEHAVFATGLSSSGSSIGGIIYPVLFRRLLGSTGFAWTCRIFALMNGVLLLAACLIMKPHKRIEESAEKPFNWRTFFDSKLLLFGSCGLFMDIGIDVPFYFIPTFALRELNLSSEVADFLLAAMNGSSLLGRLSLNLIAGYTMPVWVWQFSILASCVLLFCWFTVQSLAGIVTFIVFYGFFVGGLISLVPPSVHSTFPESDVFGARLGLVEGFQGVGFLIGPPIAGAILETEAKYLGVSLFLGTIYFALFMVVGVFTWGRGGTSSSRGGPDGDLELLVVSPSAGARSEATSRG
ncbi:MFS general substrate transporter [Hypoxylon crocopeplum]|nr:MFS general substrate transporter [Hypoxylon crocopeplum]